MGEWPSGTQHPRMMLPLGGAENKKNLPFRLQASRTFARSLFSYARPM